MKSFALTIEDFSFPPELDKSKANFRLVAELNYFDKSDRPRAASGAIPALDSYWECDWTRARRRPPRYVGPDPGPRGGKPEGYGTIDPRKINPHDKLAVMVNSNGGFYSLNCTLYDVDRADFWDQALAALSDVADSLIGRFDDLVPADIEIPQQLRGAMTRKLAGPGDRIIGAAGILLANRSGDHQVRISVGSGDYRGEYRITFRISGIA